MRSIICSILFLTVLTCGWAAGERTVISTAVAPTYLHGNAGAVGTITRQLLTSEELVAAQPVHIGLKLRNHEELKARIERGEILSVDELSSRYLPLPETWRRVSRWATAQGLSVAGEDTARMTVFVAGSVAQVETALQLKFARVIGTDGKECTSAITPPSVPSEIAEDIAGMYELQPHRRPLPRQTAALPQNESGQLLPGAIAQHYNTLGHGVDGTGQTIVVVGGSRVNPDDLALFWTKAGLPTTLAQFTAVYPTTNPQVGDNTMAGEETMDLEWASAMAPGANLVYFGNISPDVLASWILAENSAGRKIHQVTCSYTISEGFGYDGKHLNTFSTYFSAMAAVGVTYFVSSGDAGSNVDIVGTTLGGNRYYQPGGVLAPDYAASDPYVTAVGGTTLAFPRTGSGAPIAPAQEGGWCLDIGYSPTGQAASGGGISRLYMRPAWQTGSGIPAGTQRLVPDVAAVAACNFGLYFQFRGYSMGANGTSLSAPVWAGFSALLNQARAKAGLPPIGLLGPKVYPLIGSDCFNQITTGAHNGTDPFYANATNGAYAVGPNYNMVTGLGSPNIGKLIAALSVPEVNTVPTITRQPQNQTVTTGHEATLVASGTGNPAPAFQWQVSTDGGTTWSNLTNNSTYAGVTTETLGINGAPTSLSGNRYRCSATNSAGTTNSITASLSVNPDFFPFPGCIAVDASGNLYVGDESTDTIQKITPAGQVATLAGSSGTAGSSDGTGTAARFNNPGGIAATAAGILTVADTANATVRRVTATGVVTTLAGSASNRGNADGPGVSATFSAPVGLALDGSERFWVADATNHTIRRIATDGTVSTQAGRAGTAGTTDGAAANALFNQPRGIAIDASGNVYVADTTNNTIRKISPAMSATTLAGLAGVNGATDGVGSAALFNNPGGLAVDGTGNIYVADTGNSSIRRISPDGAVVTIVGMSGVAGLKDGTGSEAWLNQPRAVAMDSSGNLYVADTGNAAIRKVTPERVVTTLALTAAPSNNGGGGSSGGSGGGGVTPIPSTGGGGGGGGGAPSVWFIGLLVSLWLLRRMGFGTACVS